jgi:tetratricopeptide (TPR) repeat protein
MKNIKPARQFFWVMVTIVTAFVLLSLIKYEFFSVKDFLREGLKRENLLVDSNRVAHRAKIKDLNHTIPSALQLVEEISKTGKARDASELAPYIIYYDKITRYLEGMFDAYAFLGLCHYYSGHYENAVSSWVKSLESNSQFFWPNYNLAVVFYQTGNFDEALVFLQKAALSNPQETIDAVSSSKVYQQVFSQNPQLAKQWPQQLRAAYGKTFHLQTAIFFRLGVSHFEAGNLDRAAFFMSEVIKRDSAYPDPYFYLGKIYESQKQGIEAAKMFQTARSLASMRKENSYQFHPKVF